MKPGVNVYGYVYAESGVGEHTRLLISSIREAGIDYSVVPFENTLSRQESDFADLGSQKTDFDINIIGVNADQMDVFVEHFGEGVLRDRHNIALWAWEVEEFPDWMAKSSRWVDEIWANSSFSARAISQKVSCPVHPFPLPIRTPESSPMSRFELDLPEGFLFLFCFDYDSVFDRKNPLAVVEAFKVAAPEIAGSHLVLKSINGDRHPEVRARLESAAAPHRAITVKDGYISSDRQDQMMASCDAYVSLHRAEGFGLTMAEAMALGKPVIATGYSGNLDFMSGENSFLVPFSPGEIGPGKGPYPETCRWAEPDVSAAARMMVEAARESRTVARKISHARNGIAEGHSPAVRSRFVRERLSAIRSRRRGEVK